MTYALTATPTSRFLAPFARVPRCASPSLRLVALAVSRSRPLPTTKTKCHETVEAACQRSQHLLLSTKRLGLSFNPALSCVLSRLPRLPCGVGHRIRAVWRGIGPVVLQLVGRERGFGGLCLRSRRPAVPAPPGRACRFAVDGAFGVMIPSSICALP